MLRKQSSETDPADWFFAGQSLSQFFPNPPAK